jgi:hypothetical protein
MLVQCRRKTKDGDKEIDVPDIEAKSVFHDGQEPPWKVPTATEVEEYLKATARDLFGESLPEERKLAFDARTAAARVREKLNQRDKPAAAQDGATTSASKPREQRAKGSA